MLRNNREQQMQTVNRILNNFKRIVYRLRIIRAMRFYKKNGLFDDNASEEMYNGKVLFNVKTKFFFRGFLSATSNLYYNSVLIYGQNATKREKRSWYC